MKEPPKVRKALREWAKHRKRLFDTADRRDKSRQLRDPTYFAQSDALENLENEHLKRTMQALWHLLKVAGSVRARRLISERLRSR